MAPGGAGGYILDRLLVLAGGEGGSERPLDAPPKRGTELVLEPDGHPAVRPFKAALVSDGIPFTSFAVEDVHGEVERLHGLGARFTQEPVEMGSVTTAVFDDTCGNLIRIAYKR